MIRTPILTRASLRGCAAAVLFAGLVYLNALDNPFVYDDYRTIVDNGTIVDLTDVRALMLHDASRPIVNLSYAIDHAIWGGRPFGFHLTNVLLHMLNVALLFVLAWKATEESREVGKSGSIEVGMRPFVVAFVAASLFAVHPMMT